MQGKMEKPVMLQGMPRVAGDMAFRNSTSAYHGMVRHPS